MGIAVVSEVEVAASAAETETEPVAIELVVDGRKLPWDMKLLRRFDMAELPELFARARSGDAIALGLVQRYFPGVLD
jgi:hypothetical protein